MFIVNTSCTHIYHRYTICVIFSYQHSSHRINGRRLHILQYIDKETTYHTIPAIRHLDCNLLPIQKYTRCQISMRMTNVPAFEGSTYVRSYLKYQIIIFIYSDRIFIEFQIWTYKIKLRLKLETL